MMVRWIQMIFGIQMYHEEMQVKFEYGCDPIFIEGVIALGRRKLLENEFPFIFSLMVGWIQMIFGIQIYHILGSDYAEFAQHDIGDVTITHISTPSKKCISMTSQ
jgi:hypothetical protein